MKALLKHLKLSNLLSLLIAPIRNNQQKFYYLLGLALVSGFVVILYVLDRPKGTLEYSLVYTCSIFLSWSFVSSYVVCATIALLPKNYNKILLAFVVIIYNVLIIAHYYYWYAFDNLIRDDVMAILLHTEINEIREFLQTYIDVFVVVITIFVSSILNIVLIFWGKVWSKWRYSVGITFVASGLSTILLCWFMFNDFVKTLCYHPITNIVLSTYSAVRQNQVSEELINSQRDVVDNFSVTSLGNIDEIVFVIGESHSVYHSSLYGYGSQTQPKMNKLLEADELVVFSDVVTAYSLTINALPSIFSMSEYKTDFNSYALFPACFKSAGYYTAIYDNQVRTNHFLVHQDIVRLLFDFRNNIQYRYDYDLVNSIQRRNDKQKSLYILHLKGQHYDYNDKYPSDFEHFNSADYDNSGKYSASMSDVLAKYDNAMLYNDYVLDVLINKFRKANSLIVYCSDHGEEVYDCRTYMGHGNAATSPDIRYQARVPMFVWMSQSCREENPELWNKLNSKRDTPISTDDISHFLVGLANIPARDYDATRDFLSDEYNESAARLIDGVDYDKRVAGYLH